MCAKYMKSVDASRLNIFNLFERMDIYSILKLEIIQYRDVVAFY